MPARKINIDGQDWSVTPSGYITQYDQDEFGLFFTRGTGETREDRRADQAAGEGQKGMPKEGTA